MSMTIEWELTPTEQGGIQYYTGTSSLAEIDAVARVPSYPSSINNREWARRVFDAERTDDQWQRPLDLERVNSISEFSSVDSNWMLNSIMLYLPTIKNLEHCSPESIKFQNREDGKVVLEIDLLGFLHEDENGTYKDWKKEGTTEKDLRPLLLIDGQHRTRGGSSNQFGKLKEVPIIVITEEYFAMKDVARLFTEINTESVELGPLHKLHLRHRFELKSDEEKDDFRKPEAVKFDERRRRFCRANRLSYELAARMCKDKDSPLRDLIKMMDRKKTKKSELLDANAWIKETHHWFNEFMPFFDDENLDFDEIVQCVKSYFHAFIAVADHDNTGISKWKDGNSRWDPEKTNLKNKPKSYIRSQFPFRSLLLLFPRAFYLSLSRHNVKIPSKGDFVQILLPLSWIDWNDTTRLDEAYGKTKDTPTDLYTWMAWAIEDGRVHPQKEVWTDKRELCLPGRGFLSPPCIDSMLMRSNLKSGDKWPKKGDSLLFTSQTPPNCRPKAEWGKACNPEKRKMPAIKIVGADESAWGFKADQELENADSFEVSSIWENSISHESIKMIFKKDPNGLVILEGHGKGGDSADSATSTNDDSGGDGSGGDEHSPQPMIFGVEHENREDEEEEEYHVTSSFDDDRGPILPPPPPKKSRARRRIHRGLYPTPIYARRCEDCFQGRCKNHNCISKMPDFEKRELL